MAVIALFSACSKSSSLVEVTHIPVKLKEDGNWSLVELKTGKLFFEGEFKNEPSVVTDGIFITQNDKGKFFYNKIESDKKYNQFAGPYVSAQSFTEGLAIVCKEDDYVSAINTKGEEVFKLKPENGIDFEVVGQCFEGMIIFRTKSGYLGYLDKEGKVAIKPSYDHAEDFKDGYARVSKNVKGKDKIQVIDKEGKVKADLDYSLVSNVDAGLMAYSNTKDEFGVIDVAKDKEKLITAKGKYEKIIIVNGDIFYSSDDEWGMLDRNGEISIRAKYKTLSRINSERFLGIKKDGDETKYEILDLKGEIVKSQDVDDAYTTENGYILVHDGKDYEIKNHDGEAVGKEVFKAVEGFKDIIRLRHKISDASYNQYFDWSLIENSIKQIGQESIFGVKLDENCIAAEKHIASIALGGKSEDSEEAQARGMARSGISVRMGINSIYFAGSGYADEDSDVASENSTPEYDESPVDSVAAVTPSEPSSTTKINDNAPEWTSYQRTLDKNISVGRYSRINFEVWFDNTIKSPITNTVYKTDAYWGYTYPVTETVGYEKNANAKVYYMSVSYDIEGSKEEKMKKLLSDFIKSKGYKFVTESDGKKYYIDSKNNSWILDGTTIILEKQSSYSDTYSTATDMPAMPADWSNK